MTPKASAKEISRLAEFVSNRLEELSGDRNQREIAEIAGFGNQNMITMIKQGRTKVAIDRVPMLALALQVDQAPLMRLALEQFYSAATLNALEMAFQDMNQHEHRILEEFRKALKKKPMTAGEVIEKIQAVFA